MFCSNVKMELLPTTQCSSLTINHENSSKFGKECTYMVHKVHKRCGIVIINFSFVYMFPEKTFFIHA